MALKNFILKNKKRTSIIVAAIVLLVVAVVGVTKFKSNANAGVFVRDENGQIEEKTDINILEIVAENGEQVIGYTVPGSEPISVEQIENYHGNIDVKAFEEATGYVLNKKDTGNETFSYTVVDARLNDTFNLNVLGESMNDGEIRVTVCQARDLTPEIINSADFIYVNSNNSDNNLYYFYDQIVNNGAAGAEPGVSGPGYTDFTYVENIRTTAALKNIRAAAGSIVFASAITEEDYARVGVDNVMSVNMEAYAAGLAKLEKGELDSDNDEETIKRIAKVITQVNSEQEGYAFEYINGVAGKGQISEEETVEVYRCFEKGCFTNCTTANYPDYLSAILANGLKYANKNAIQSMMTTQNVAIMNAGMNHLIDVKNNPEKLEKEDIMNTLARLSYAGYREFLSERYAEAFWSEDFKFTSTTVNGAFRNIKTMITEVNNIATEEAKILIASAPTSEEAMAKLEENANVYFELVGLENYFKYNLNYYIQGMKELENKLQFLEEVKAEEETTQEETTQEETEKESVYEETEKPIELNSETENESTVKEETTALDPTSSTNKETTVEDITDESSKETNEEVTEETSEETTEEDTSVVNPEETSDNSEEETTGVASQESEKNNAGNAAESTTSIEYEGKLYTYNLENIEAFLASVNETEMKFMEKLMCDISWESAKALYDYAIVQERGMMYDTSLLTGKIGNCKEDLSNAEEGIDNTNKLYKILLLTRQMNRNYCEANILTKVDDFGIYYPEGLTEQGAGIGNGIASWNKDTFCTNKKDYVNFREPDVVGKTYNENGVEGADTNYIYKHIYSYTGDQFAGGKLFIGEGQQEGHVVTTGAIYSDSEDAGVIGNVKNTWSNQIYFDKDSQGNGVFKNWDSPRALFWKNSNSYKRVVMDYYYNAAGNKIFKTAIVSGYNQIRFAKSDNYQNWATQATSLGGENTCYFAYRDNGGDKTRTTGTLYDVTLSNSILGKNVDYKGVMDVKFYGINSQSIEYSIDDGEWKKANYGDVITIGAGLPVGTKTTIKLRYADGSSINTSKTFYYTKKQESSGLTVTNASKENVVEFYGTTINANVLYTGLSKCSYSINGSAFTDIASGENIVIGEGKKPGDKIKVTFKYRTTNGTEKTVEFNYKKIGSPDGDNFLSKKTATNTSALKEDATQDVTVNQLIKTGNKGDVIRYCMGVSLNELAALPLRILEIQPSAYAGEMGTYEKAVELADWLRVELPDMNSKNYKEYFQVTSMSVREFNTRNMDLTGDFDLIYFGVNSGYFVLDSNTKRTKFRDTGMNGLVYYGIGDEYNIQGFLKGVAAEDYGVLTGAPSKTSVKNDHQYWKDHYFDGFTGNQNASWNLDKNKYYYLDGTNTTTRLGGNDLTVLSMNKLLDYAKAGYPILMCDEMINCDTAEYVAPNTTSDSTKWRYVDVYSKMYNFVVQLKKLGYDEAAGKYTGLDKDGNRVFSDNKNYANLVSLSYAKYGRNPDNLPDDQKFHGGLSFATKRNVRVMFELLDCPTEYSRDKNDHSKFIKQGTIGNIIQPNEAEYTTYRFVLQIKSKVTMEWMSQNYGYELYIDKSGTGRFEKKYTVKVSPNYEYSDSKNQVIIEGNWPGNMDGFVPWKIVAYNKNNPNNHFEYTGFSSFKIENRKQVNVLWVITCASGKESNLDFKKMVKEHYTDKMQDREFDIDVDSIWFKDFVNKYESDPSVNVNTKFNRDNSKLKVKNFRNGYTGEEEYNMIVFGFCDSFGGLDIANTTALNNLRYFIKSGHSLFFAHDNVSYVQTMNYYDSNGNSNFVSYRWGNYNTSFFRTMLGMDMYGVTYSGNVFNPLSTDYDEEIANTRKYLRPDLKQRDLRGLNEVCAFHYTSSGKGNELYSSTLNGTSAKKITDWCITKRVLRMNRGQITEYPFYIGEEINVADTHTQYNTLDLDDSETTVWYTLSSGNGGTNNDFYKYTRGDGANNFYIYSKGNITYTGSGHTKDQTDIENQLFINTVIAAIKLGNFEPEVTIDGAETNSQGENIVYAYDIDDYASVGFTGIDYDFTPGAGEADTPFSDCKIYIDVDGDGKYTPGVDFLLNDPTGNAPTGYLKDELGVNDVNFTGDDIYNMEKNKFTIPYELFDEIAQKAGLPDGKTLYDYNIGIELLEKDTLNDAGEVEETGTAIRNSFKLVKSSVFNLN